MGVEKRVRIAVGTWTGSNLVTSAAKVRCPHDSEGRPEFLNHAFKILAGSSISTVRDFDLLWIPEFPFPLPSTGCRIQPHVRVVVAGEAPRQNGLPRGGRKLHQNPPGGNELKYQANQRKRTAFSSENTRKHRMEDDDWRRNSEA